MKTKFALHAILAVSIIALPLHAQHGHGGGGGAAGVPHGPGMGGMSTPHSSDHPSNHDSNRGSGKQQSSVSQRLTDNTKLASKLQGLLPAGTNLQQAAQGFKNLGQFVAAVHVSHNLGIPFDQLKAKMTGTSPESLGKAIHDLKPSADSKAETKKAEKEATHDMDDSRES